MNTTPKTFQEYEQRFMEHQRVTGYGIGNVYVHMPCPFCAAPDFLDYEVLSVQEAMGRGATCSECGRSARALYFKEAADGSVSFEIVQTGGDDPPIWLTPKMRRVNR